MNKTPEEASAHIESRIDATGASKTEIIASIAMLESLLEHGVNALLMQEWVNGLDEQCRDALGIYKQARIAAAMNIAKHVSAHFAKN